MKIINKFKSTTTFIALYFTLTSLVFAQDVAEKRSKRIHRKTDFRIVGTLQSLDVKSRGDITVSDNDDDITSISRGGYLRIRKTAFGNKKEVLIESDDEGNLNKYYYDNRSETPFEPEGRRWLRDILPDVVRSSGIAAESRVNRFFNQGGAEAVLDEIEELTSNSVRGRYFGLLLTKNGLNARDLSRIAREVSDEVSSSSQQGDIFRKYSHKFLASEESAEHFFNSIGKISSSSEQGYTLRQILRKDKLTAGMKAELLDATDNISSSSERGTVLREFNEQFDPTPEVVDAYFDALDGISSSSEKGSVLRDLLKMHDLSEDILERLFESVDDISSSSERGSVLRVAILQIKGKEKSLEQFFTTVGRISSSSEIGSVLRNIIDEAELRSEYMPQLFETVDRISSSSERGSVLRRAIPYLDNDPEATDQFFSSVEKISSSSEQGDVIITLLGESKKLDNRTLIEALKASEGISSSSTRVEVMLAVAEWIDDGDSDVMEVYKDVAKSIDSSSGYRTVMERVF